MTRTSWHLVDPAAYDLAKRTVTEKYHHLHFVEHNGIVIIRGSFPVLFEQRELDRFAIEVIIPPDFSRDLPLVRVTGGRIPPILDRHINNDGFACLFVAEEKAKYYPDGSSLLDFFDGPVHSFFLGQALVDRGEPWPFGERSHGVAGIREYYEELLATTDISVILKYLQCLTPREQKGHWECPCGSGRKLRHCHGSFVYKLRQSIPRKVAKVSYEALKKEYGTQSPS